MVTKSILLPGLSCSFFCVQCSAQYLMNTIRERKRINEGQRAGRQAGMQQAAKRWCTDPLLIYTQRRLTLQDPCPSALHFESTLNQRQRMREWEQSRKIRHLYPVCVCACAYLTLSPIPAKHHYMYLISLIHLPRVHICIHSHTQGHMAIFSQTKPLNMYCERHLFQIIHESLHDWLCVWKT